MLLIDLFSSISTWEDSFFNRFIISVIRSGGMFSRASWKSWFCAVSWRKWHICALNRLRILMKENPSNLGHCPYWPTCCLRFHFWSLGFPLQWASVKVTRCSGWVVVGCCADELLALALAGSCTEYLFYWIMLERIPIFGNIWQSSLILYQIHIKAIASSHVSS